MSERCRLISCFSAQNQVCLELSSSCSVPPEPRPCWAQTWCWNAPLPVTRRPASSGGKARSSSRAGGCTRASARPDPAARRAAPLSPSVLLCRNKKFSLLLGTNLIIRSVTDDDSGSYSCTAANRNQNISAHAELSVLGKPTVAGWGGLGYSC